MNDDLKTWNDGAEDYLTVASEENDQFKKFVDTPRFLSLLGNVQGKKVLDIGCGNGDFCKKLGDSGTELIVGLDGSEKMINAAKKNYPTAKYLVNDLMTEEIPFDDNYFDIITSKMMLMNVNSIKILSEKVYRVLKKEGIFAVDVVHPFRPLLKSNSQDGRYDKSFNYFHETHSSIEFAKNKYAYYYRPVNKYLNDIVESGFTFIKMDELGMTEEFVAKYPKEISKLNTPISLHLLFKK